MVPLNDHLSQLCKMHYEIYKTRKACNKIWQLISFDPASLVVRDPRTWCLQNKKINLFGKWTKIVQMPNLWRLKSMLRPNMIDELSITILQKGEKREKFNSNENRSNKSKGCMPPQLKTNKSKSDTALSLAWSLLWLLS